MLETDVNEGQPLLLPATKGKHSFLPIWGTDDRGGHGTFMADLAQHDNIRP